MKNMVMYYYKLNNIKAYKIKNKNLFRDKNNIFILEPINNRRKILDIYKEIADQKNYSKILTNINNDIFTNIYGIDYVLIEKKDIKYDLSKEIEKVNIIRNSAIINKPDWSILWESKLDYYEYQIAHIRGNYNYIDESVFYFIGMGETAISYIRYNIVNNNEKIVISHKRIDENNLYNPLNITFDYRARDISEYLKFVFFNKNMDKFNLYNFFKKINFSRDSFILLFARMLFPSYYFDLYDDIINNREAQIKVIGIIKRIKEYESFLNDIYVNISKIVEIPSVNWL